PNSHTTAATRADLRGALGSEKITGGTISLGDASSGTARTFILYGGGSVPNLTLSNASAVHSANVVAAATGLSVRGTFSRPATTGTFSLNGTSQLIFHGDVSNSGPITANTAGSSLVFWGTADQTLGGSLTSS